MRRLRAVEIVAPGALSRLIAALDIPAERAARLRRDPEAWRSGKCRSNSRLDRGPVVNTRDVSLDFDAG